MRSRYASFGRKFLRDLLRRLFLPLGAHLFEKLARTSGEFSHRPEVDREAAVLRRPSGSYFLPMLLSIFQPLDAEEDRVPRRGVRVVSPGSVGLVLS